MEHRKRRSRHMSNGNTIYRGLAICHTHDWLTFPTTLGSRDCYYLHSPDVESEDQCGHPTWKVGSQDSSALHTQCYTHTEGLVLHSSAGWRRTEEEMRNHENLDHQYAQAGLHCSSSVPATATVLTALCPSEVCLGWTQFTISLISHKSTASSNGV